MKASAGSQWPPTTESRSGSVDTIAFITYTCSSYAVAQPHEHSEHRILNRPIIIHGSSGASACATTSSQMATAEQMQEALQQIQILTARVTTLETQLQFESARAQTAEQERSALIQTLVTTRQERAGGMVDPKGIGQPFMWKGSADQDFGVWSHKVRTFMLARFGDDVLTALT